MHNLLVCLPPTNSGPDCNYDHYVTDGAQSVIDSGCATASDLPALQGMREIVAVVPVGMLSWHLVVLPDGTGPASPRLRTLLASLLEDRLLDEVDAVHLAISQAPNEDGRWWVAACDRQWLSEHVQALGLAGRSVQRIVPEFSPAEGPARLYVTGTAGAPRLTVTGNAVGGLMTLRLTPASIALLSSVRAGGDVVLSAEAAVADIAEGLLQHKPAPLPVARRYLDASCSNWNLAQFELAPVRGFAGLKRLWNLKRDLLGAPAWRAARWAAAFLLALNLFGLNAWAWQERVSLKSRREAMANIMATTFPGVKIVIDAPLQMEREVRSLELASGTLSARDLEAVLTSLALAAPAGRSAGAIEFSATGARFKGLQLDAQEFATLETNMKKQGYAVNASGDILAVAPIMKAGDAP